jgi:cobalt-zinc-cadmium efflux system membrane fusion protein
MRFDWRAAVLAAAVLALVIAVTPRLRVDAPSAAAADATTLPQSGPPTIASDGSITLNESQLKSITVEAATERQFPQENEAYGSIDFNEDVEVPVFTPYQGRILEAYPVLGDTVKKGQILFTIESPDLIQAESTLIAAAGVLALTTRALDRARDLYAKQALAQKDLEQAESDQMTADGAFKAARDAVRIFGKTDTDIDSMVKRRQIDKSLVVPSPIAGVVAARNAQPGLFVQPANPPAPYTVADISTVWLLANVDESDTAAYRIGQPVKVSLMAYPGRTFTGKISRISASVDPNIHRLLVRSEVPDSNHELKPGMFANFVIETGPPMTSTAAPLDAVVREADGTQTLWVTTDRHRFVQRVVKIGEQRDGFRQILEGLKPGELIATTGALLLDNILNNAGSAT